MQVLSVDGRRVRRAREYLAVQLGIVQFAALGAAVVATELLSGMSRSSRPLGYSCAALSLSFAGAQSWMPAKRSLMWMFAFGSGAYVALASGAIAATGGAASPIRVLLILAVVYGAWFYQTRPAVLILVAVMLATLLPLVYDTYAFSPSPLAQTITLAAAVLVAGALTILGRIELTRLRDAARSDARLDALTEVANRRALIRQLEKLCADQDSCEHFGLVFLDLDGFKHINTEFGHAGGDAVLRTVAGVLRRAARSEDLVARMGGDEFAVIARGIRDDALRFLAHRLVAAVEDVMLGDVLAGAVGARVGASAGVATWPDDAADPETLLRVADLALLSAKRAGKGRVISTREDGGPRQAERRCPARQSVVRN